MNHKPAVEWKHTTTTFPQGEPQGIDLFDDEQPDSVSIYLRFADQTRFPARTVDLSSPDAGNILGAWLLKGQVHDYRTFGQQPDDPRQIMRQIIRQVGDPKALIDFLLEMRERLPSQGE